jgi:MFS family permease
VKATTDHPSILRTVRDISVPVWALLAGTFVNKLGSFLQIFLVLFLTHRGFTAAAAGLALGAYGAGAIAGVVAGGSVTDRLGYRWTIAGSMAVAAVLTVVLLLASQLWAVLLVSAAIGAAAQAYRPASSALLAELTPASQQVMVFAIYRLAMNLGMTAGPLLGVLLIRSSYDLLFWGDAITSIAFAALAVVLLPRHVRRPAAVHEAAGVLRRGYLRVLADRRFVLVLAAMFVSQVVYIQYLSVLPLHVQAQGYVVQVYGGLVSLNALIVICCEVPLTQFVQRLPARVAVMLGMGLVGVGLDLYLVPAGLAGLVVATLVWSFGETIGSPALSAYPGQVAPPELRGRYLASAAASAQLGYAIGPVVGALVWARVGPGVWGLCGLVTIAAVAGIGAGMRQPGDREVVTAGPVGPAPVGHAERGTE